MGTRGALAGDGARNPGHGMPSGVVTTMIIRKTMQGSKNKTKKWCFMKMAE